MTSDLLDPARVAIALGAEIPACEGMVVWEAWIVWGEFAAYEGSTGGLIFFGNDTDKAQRIGIYTSRETASAALANVVTPDGDTAVLKVVIG